MSWTAEQRDEFIAAVLKKAEGLETLIGSNPELKKAVKEMHAYWLKRIDAIEIAPEHFKASPTNIHENESVDFDTLIREGRFYGSSFNLNGEQFQVGSLLGQGTFGTVYSLQNNPDQVVKFVTCSRYNLTELQAIREVAFQRKFDHPHLLGIKSVGITELGSDRKRSLVIILPKAEQSFSDWAAKHQESPSFYEDVTTLMEHAAKGIEHLHQQGVLHRDIKPANILVRETASAIHGMVSDFGTVTDLSEVDLLANRVGTSAYLAPELADKSKVAPATKAADVYALGKSWLEMITGGFDIEQLPEQYAYSTLIRSMLATDPAQRPSMSEVVNHLDQTERFDTVSLDDSSVSTRSTIFSDTDKSSLGTESTKSILNVSQTSTASEQDQDFGKQVKAHVKKTLDDLIPVYKRIGEQGKIYKAAMEILTLSDPTDMGSELGKLVKLGKKHPDLYFAIIRESFTLGFSQGDITTLKAQLFNEIHAHFIKDLPEQFHSPEAFFQSNQPLYYFTAQLVKAGIAGLNEIRFLMADVQMNMALQDMPFEFSDALKNNSIVEAFRTDFAARMEAATPGLQLKDKSLEALFTVDIPGIRCQLKLLEHLFADKTLRPLAELFFLSNTFGETSDKQKSGSEGLADIERNEVSIDLANQLCTVGRLLLHHKDTPRLDESNADLHIIHRYSENILKSGNTYAINLLTSLTRLESSQKLLQRQPNGSF